MTATEIRDLRTKSGMTLHNYVKATGISTNTVWRLESGKTEAKGETLKKLEKFRDVLAKQKPSQLSNGKQSTSQKKVRFSATPAADSKLPEPVGRTYKIVILDANSSKEIISVDTQDRALVLDMIERMV